MKDDEKTAETDEIKEQETVKSEQTEDVSGVHSSYHIPEGKETDKKYKLSRYTRTGSLTMLLMSSLNVPCRTLTTD